MLYRQVYRRFKEAILSGTYPPGMRVPSIRTLASELKLSRNTIENAYDLLNGEGFFVSNGQAGTTIADLGFHQLTPRPAQVEPKSAAARLTVRPFQIGVPALDAFPLSIWHTLCQRQLKSRHEISQILSDVQGYLPLREAIAAYLSVSRGISCTPSRVFITSGYRQSMLLLASTLLKAGDAVWIEDPSYPPARQLFGKLGIRQVPVPVDAEGMDVSEGVRLAPDARMALLSPANQSPLGTVLSMSRRMALLSWAESHSAWLIEDDYDSEYCSDGRLLPTLSSLDRLGRTCYLGTFSKTLHPELRLAYAVVPEGLVETVSETAGQLLDGCPLHEQKALATFIADGHFGRHLKKMRTLYVRRREMLVEALQSRLAGHVHISPFSRGLCLLVYLADDCDDVAIAQRACAAGLSVASLSPRATEDNHKRGLLLGFANIVDAQSAEQDVETLAACLATAELIPSGSLGRGRHFAGLEPAK
ncbi:GntR family transcriptional regulator / MocR family aminotransferase [Pseudogulbenkiania subflava DSM 22618]|uniref:Putative 8-amino-7-oxononanoate synthase n=1 Tax=Pseudogulbenkiania subflava DSM 22618 TaxID=1123014 RepID=A0A1Y6BRB3_9NEIS|nr:GntR family transcriptional regulator / MocR family aminotransferase [Pseudogulbenkiania subflava DSM 22618]